MTDAAVAPPKVFATDTIKTTGILHFTIGVRDIGRRRNSIPKCSVAR